MILRIGSRCDRGARVSVWFAKQQITEVRHGAPTRPPVRSISAVPS